MFFFSSRRRHTRSLCDWSSDVCSSDLPSLHPPPFPCLLGSCRITSPMSCLPRPGTSKNCVEACSIQRVAMAMNWSCRPCWSTSNPCSPAQGRSEEHTSELQSHSDLVCRLLLEKKKKMQKAQRKDEYKGGQSKK